MSSANKFRRISGPIAVAAVVLGAVLSACGSGDDASPAPATTSAAPASTSAATSPPVAGQQTSAPAQPPTVAKTQGWLQIFSGPAPAGTANAVQLTVASNPAVGQYVSDAAGRSLYRFDNDTAKPPVSNCAGQCATNWPPLIVARDQSSYVSGVDPQLVGFIERADGTCQITVGGWPVYYFAKDQKAGDLLGQGVGGTWFAVAPNGAKATAN